MSKIKLYIATSLDGFIAREDGSLDWLHAIPNPKEIDYGYADFYNTIDTIIMGRNTYNEILGFGVEWPYEKCKSYVITRDTEFSPTTKNTEVINALNTSILKELKHQASKDIWVVGGGVIISQLLNIDEIDEMILCLIPTIIGRGIQLFPNHPKETSFELKDTKRYDTGIINLLYKKRA